MSPKRRASTPEPSTSSSDASSDSSSSEGERLPAQQTTRSGRVSRPPARPLINPGKLFSELVRDTAARRRPRGRGKLSGR
jgi:hypothetical protein